MATTAFGSILSGATLDDLNGYVNVLGWNTYTTTMTYASSTTVTISGDVTSLFPIGTKVKFTQTTAKYFVVKTSSYGAPNTTLTLQGGDSYTVANAAIGSVYYSYGSPFDWPSTFLWTTGFAATGFSSGHVYVAQYSVIDGQCKLDFRTTTAGTSNATTFAGTLPFAMTGQSSSAVRTSTHNVVDNSSSLTTPGLVTILTTGTTVNMYKDSASGAWTSSGTKGCTFSIMYPYM